MAAEKKYSGMCNLDNDGCVSLYSILRSFNAPISEEQAWAVCYQTAKCFKKAWEVDSTNCCCLADTCQLFIHKDGTVPIKTALPKKDVTSSAADTEYKLVTSLGVTLFHALDFGLCEDEERSLSPTLELVIDRMTSADPDDDAHADDSSSSDETASQNADEGIERDSGEDDPTNTADGQQKGGLTLDRVLEMCAARLKSPSQSDAHYRAVCRALVAEALELSTFLEKVSHGTKELLQNSRSDPSESNLDSLEVKDWARLWMQVIRQLRQGVKLKKVGMDNMPHKIEFELTPYEMLLDDIRSRRYKLNKVMVNGDIPPRVKKDAHALILEFIRSRPPLIPASKRKLRPLPPRQPTLYEKLMASLKQQHKLRPTTPENRKDNSENTEQEGDSKPQSSRRLIKVDPALRLSTSFGDDDDDDEWDEMFKSPTDAEPDSPFSDDVFQISENFTDERRHSMPSFASSKRLSKETKPPLLKARTLSENHSSQNNAVTNNNTSEYWRLSQWQSLECLSLTLEEVVHIRSVLTKAELESLLVVPSLYEDVARGKICFTCKKTKFSFFGSWGVKCKLCERTVCSKCCTKMHIPTEQFANIPVYMLSPAPAQPDDLDNFLRRIPDTFNFSRNNQTSVELPDDSPVFGEKMKQSESFHALSIISTESGDSQPQRPSLLRSKTVHHRSEESLIECKPAKSAENVCTDCKEMLCHIMLTSQVSETTDRYSKTWRKQSNGLMATSSFASSCAESLPD